MSTNSALHLQDPWPGPVPYGEDDQDRFFGRDDEVRKLLGLLQSHTLTVLSAWSGVGKSSLIQAGLLPALRRARRHEGVGFALLVREWSERAGRSPGIGLVDAVVKALKDQEVRAVASNGDDRDLLRRLGDVPVPPLAGDGGLSYRQRRLVVGYLAELAEVGSGLVLIVDQAEELMGSGIGPPDLAREDELLTILGLLHKEAPAVHTLISLRDEYVGRLKPLSLYVDGLDKRTISLEQLPRRRAEDAIQCSLQQPTGLEMTLDGVREILDWLTGPARDDGETLADRPVDLLRMQALLVDILREARAGAGDGPVRLDREFLQGYLHKYAPGRTPAALASVALERHLERLLTTIEVVGGDAHGPHVARRIAARMGPWLSSPGNFKRPSEECELLYNVLREDLEGAGYVGGAEQAVKAIAMWKDCELEGDPPLDFIPSDPDDPVPWASGVARAWEPKTAQARTVRELTRAGLHALKHLVKHNVLKRTLISAHGTRDRTFVYELVHDGFGGALVEYGEKERQSVRDTLAALVSQRGRNFKWTRTDERLDNVCWVGCNVVGTTFEKATFTNCILKGTIFINCRFIDCRFVDCDLDGAVFTGGEVAAFVRTVISGGRAYSILFNGVLFEDVRLEGVRMDGATITNVRLRSRLELADVTLAFSQFRSFHTDGEDVRVTFVECDLRNALLSDLQEAFVTVDNVSNATAGLVPELPERRRRARIQAATSAPG